MSLRIAGFLDCFDPKISEYVCGALNTSLRQGFVNAVMNRHACEKSVDLLIDCGTARQHAASCSSVGSRIVIMLVDVS